jgi:hypothetical protein
MIFAKTELTEDLYIVHMEEFSYFLKARTVKPAETAMAE